MHQLSRPARRRINSFEMFEACVACSIIIIVSPIFVINGILAAINGSPYLRQSIIQDAVGRQIVFLQWPHGILKNTLLLLNVIRGDISLCGVSLKHACHDDALAPLTSLKPGLFSLHGQRQLIGNIEMTHGKTIRFHESHNSFHLNLSIMAKTLLCHAIYQGNALPTPSTFNLFGIKIHNATAKSAVDTILSAPKDTCRSVFFVNVNSINIAVRNNAFTSALNNADMVLADGSGVRLGARRMGVKLRENVNGTDLLPHICKGASKRKLSIFMLGSAPGVAEKAAQNLQQQWPQLDIAGIHHGYFDKNHSDEVIDMINASGAGICLVAMGSPVQEQWVESHQHQLNIRTIIAVGGLFDFYSGNIRRAPQWMREIGMEWIFRLLMEPRAKFNRYVMGNPLYLLRLAFYNRPTSD